MFSLYFIQTCTCIYYGIMIGLCSSLYHYRYLCRQINDTMTMKRCSIMSSSYAMLYIGIITPSRYCLLHRCSNKWRPVSQFSLLQSSTVGSVINLVHVNICFKITNPNLNQFTMIFNLGPPIGQIEINEYFAVVLYNIEILQLINVEQFI